MTCSVCGLLNGAHEAECIKQLISINVKTLNKCVNMMYSELYEVAHKRNLNFIGMVETLDMVSDELALLRGLNSATLANNTAELAGQA